MMELDSDEKVYRFTAFAASGTVTLRSDCVYIKTRTHLGWWEQTIPLADLKPQYGLLTATPQVFIWACIFAIIFVCAGFYGLIWGKLAMPQKLLSVTLLPSGLFLGWYLVKHRKSEWIIFNTYDHGGRICYTRQGPDAKECDLFTSRLVDAIRESRQEHNKAMDAKGSIDSL